MLSLRISSLTWLSAACGLIGLLQLFGTTTAEYPGVIELVGYSNRRARTHYMPHTADNPTLAPPAAKTQADIETVKANIEKYNKLLTLDTKNLPESQKDMLQRIVERVARLKETLDIDDSERIRAAAAAVKTVDSAVAPTSTQTPTDGGVELEDDAAAAKTTSITTEAAATNAEEAETDPTLVLDETTLLQLQTSMDELAAVRAGVTAQTAIARELPAATTTTDYNFNAGNGERTEESGTDSVEIEDTTESLLMTAGGSGSSPADYYPSTTMDALTDATDADDQFVAARSNNRLAAAAIKAEPEEASGHTTIGSQRTLTTSGKLTKTRATKRPNSSGITKVGSSSSTVKRGQKPSTTAGLHRHTATNKQKLATTTTTQPALAYQQQLQQQLQLQKLQQQKQQQLALEKQQQQQQLLQQQQQQLQQLQYQKPQLPQLPPQTASSPTSYQTFNNKVSVSSPTPLTTDKSSSASSAAAAAAASTVAASSAASSPSSSYSSTPITTTLANNYGAASNDMDYEPQVNTSALIDSLNAREEFYQQKQPIGNKDKKPSATAKPTKYHYYPHNQHIYLLPECAIQQVCNAVYVRLNYTQPLCACPSRYRDPCSASLNEDDQHTTKLVGDSKKKAITLAKTCEATTEMRECSSPKDWSLLALQNIRTGKSHYLIICRCPDHFKMEGPMAHDQPKYASVPGIRVFGMMCVKPGYSVRKPSAQPPKRYQLQKPFYRPNSQSSNAYINVPQYGGAKDSYGRPSSSSASQSSSGNYHGENGFANQHSSGGYQYLNRPDSNNQALNIGNYRPDTLTSINNFPTGIYGRNNERKGETPIEAIKDDEKLSMNTSTQQQQQLAVETMPLAAAAAGDGVAGGHHAESVEETTPNANVHANDEMAVAPEDDQNGEPALPRQKRSLIYEEVANDWDDYAPDFPWDRAMEFQQTIVWD